MHDYTTFKASIGGLFRDTNIGVSSVIDTKNFSLELDLLFQTNSINVTRFDADFAYITEEKRTSSIALNEMIQVLMASYHQVIDSDTSNGARFRYPFIDHEPILTFAVEHRLDRHIWLNARADSAGCHCENLNSIQSKSYVHESENAMETTNKDEHKKKEKVFHSTEDHLFYFFFSNHQAEFIFHHLVLAFKSIVNQVAFGFLPGLSFVSEFGIATPNSGKFLTCSKLVSILLVLS
ncbi:hypothetical protein YC2023_080945 [Brassica napus]